MSEHVLSPVSAEPARAAVPDFLRDFTTTRMLTIAALAVPIGASGAVLAWGCFA